MRSRLQRGLVTEIGGLDSELRLKILEKRLAERRLLVWRPQQGETEKL